MPIRSANANISANEAIWTQAIKELYFGSAPDWAEVNDFAAHGLQYWPRAIQSGRLSPRPGTRLAGFGLRFAAGHGCLEKIARANAASAESCTTYLACDPSAHRLPTQSKRRASLQFPSDTDTDAATGK